MATITVCLFAFLLATPLAHAQWISLGARANGSVPTGSFAQEESSSNATLIEDASNGFGYGLDLAAGIGMFGLYAGFDHVSFDCGTSICASGGEYTLTGASAGIKLSRSAGWLLHPFIKGGVTFNKLKGSFGTSSSSGLSSDRAPGYEVAVGADVSLLGLLSLAPQVRYVGQNLKVKVPGVASPDPDGQGVNYLTFDLGLAVRVPFGPFSGRVSRARVY